MRFTSSAEVCLYSVRRVSQRPRSGLTGARKGIQKAFFRCHAAVNRLQVACAAIRMRTDEVWNSDRINCCEPLLFESFEVKPGDVMKRKRVAVVWTGALGGPQKTSFPLEDGSCASRIQNTAPNRATRVKSPLCGQRVRREEKAEGPPTYWLWDRREEPPSILMIQGGSIHDRQVH